MSTEPQTTDSESTSSEASQASPAHHAGPQTAGARLAAIQAAKAARKAVRKEGIKAQNEAALNASVVEQNITSRAAEEAAKLNQKTAQELEGVFQKNKSTIFMTLGALVLAIAGWVGYQNMQARGRNEAIKGVDKALAFLNAEFEADVSESEQKSKRASNRSKALEELTALIKSHPGTEAAASAHLLRAKIHLDDSKIDDAIKDYQSASAIFPATSTEYAMATEGWGMSLEAKGDLNAAKAKFALLKERFLPLALYHDARIKLAAGNKSDAIAAFKKVIEESKKIPADEDLYVFVRRQSETKLKQLDPSSAPSNSPSQFSPEMLEELVRQQQLKQKLQH